jgi:hypothetical protein
VTDAFPDVEGSLRTWLKSLASVTALVGTRVFNDVPKGAKESKTFPCITLKRIGGADDSGEAPMDNALVQIDCWGSIDHDGLGHPIKATSDVIRRTIRAELKAMDQTTLAPGVAGLGASVTSDIYIPDPTDGRPRHIVTALVYVMAV